MQFETNPFGTHELIRLIIPIMRRQGYGRIVQNSSVPGFAAMTFRDACNASKFALEAKRPKARYYVTFPTYGLGFLNRILPDRAMDWVPGNV